MKVGESLKELHIVSRHKVSVEKHFGSSCSLPLDSVIKLLRLINRDLGIGGEDRCSAQSAVKSYATKNASLFGTMSENRASESAAMQNASKLSIAT